MDDEAAKRWNERYSVQMDIPAPAHVLTRYRHLLPTSGVALDLACGRGGNALFLAANGLETHAWDISTTAIAQLNQYAVENDCGLVAEARDVVAYPPVPRSFDVIVVSRFLDRTLIDDLKAALCSGGLLFYQTFVVGNQGGPSNPDYLLKEGELLQWFTGFVVRAYEDAGFIGRTSEGFRNEALIVVQKQ